MKDHNGGVLINITAHLLQEIKAKQGICNGITETQHLERSMLCYLGSMRYGICYPEVLKWNFTVDELLPGFFGKYCMRYITTYCQCTC